MKKTMPSDKHFCGKRQRMKMAETCRLLASLEYFKEGDAMADVILETRNLTKEFKGFTAVSAVNLQVQRGRIHALIGLRYGQAKPPVSIC